MEHWKLTQWCMYAVSKIKYTPDRRAVYDELRQHLDDRCESFLERGMSKDDAVAKTVEVMGDPRELAPLLAAAHPPFWGYACSITKWLMRLTVAFTVACIIFGIIQFCDQSYQYTSTSVYAQSNDPDITRKLYLEPNCSATLDGYTFTITRAAIQHYYSKANIGKDQEYDRLYIELKVSNYLPWAYDSEALGWFWAEDSLGTHYGSYYEDTAGCIFTYTSSGDPFVQYHTFEIPIAHWEAVNWIKLHYDRDGRDIVLYIDLSGGERI